MRLLGKPPERLQIPQTLWGRLIAQLAERGEGRRESGAFLLGRPGGRRVEEILYFDDLDPRSLNGSIHLRGPAFSKLWEHCSRRGLRALADVHTHPGGSVAQSLTDRRNPLVAQSGHVALIVPRFALDGATPRHVGFHRYDGESGWTSFFGRAAARRLRLR
jgi:proteasome lid subunit RPN8/RPN11